MLDSKIIEIYKIAVDFDGTKEEFCSDYTLSSIWGDSKNPVMDNEIIYQRYKLVEKIYNLANCNVLDLAKFLGISNRQFGFKFGIPQHSIESWSMGRRTPPDYVKLILAESCGYFIF